MADGNKKLYGKTIEQWAEEFKTKSKSKILKENKNFGDLRSAEAKYGEVKAAVEAYEASLGKADKGEVEDAAGLTKVNAVHVPGEADALPAEPTAPEVETPATPVEVSSAKETGRTPSSSVQVDQIEPLTMDTVLRDLASGKGDGVGYRTRSPDVKLAPAQAELSMRIYNILRDRGVVLRNSGQVYGWILDQIALALDSKQ